MEVKLVIIATKDDDPVNTIGKEYIFSDATSISIGRGDPNNIPLRDPGRTVSRNHARLVATSDGYLLEDLESKNFTFHNEQRMEPGQKQSLQNGDTISVGDFSIEYFCSAIPQDLGVTIIDPVFNEPDFSKNNPFEEDVAQLFGTLERLCSLFDKERNESKAEYLSHALNAHKVPVEGHKVSNLFKNALSDTQVPVAPSVVSDTASSPALSTRVTREEAGPVDMRVLDTTLESLKELIRIPYEFRGEFIGHTMWQDEESTFLYEGDYKVTKDYLLDASASEADLENKLDRLKKAAEKVKIHQVGMMKGYMAVVREGQQQILMQINPASFQEELLGSNILYKLIPLLGSRRVLDGVIQKIAEMTQADWSVAEQRLYRPLFISAYMSSASDEDA